MSASRAVDGSSVTRFGAFVAVCALALSSVEASAAGKHTGERRQLDVKITFWGEYGQTVTDESGTEFRRYGGSVRRDDTKIYPSEYWGMFPLYFFDRPTGITVTITNNGPRRKAKLAIVREAYHLGTDGTSGLSLAEPVRTEIVVARGQTVEIDASFIVWQMPESQSGLNRFLVKVLHLNKGAAGGATEPGLIAVEEGVFCPPEDEDLEELWF
jgi:hypothetical protein